METDRPNVNTPENGLKILAGMIARAYQKELNEKRAQSKVANKTKEVEGCQSKD